jgi:hypothetical protein
MTAAEQEQERRNFFGRSGELVCAEFSSNWTKHDLYGRRSESQSGTGKILILETESGESYYVVESVVLYSDEYTRLSWPSNPARTRRTGRLSRSEELASMESGEAIAYPFHAHLIPYIKTVGAENIQIETLRSVDGLGQPLPGKENLLITSRIAPLLGLRKEQGYNKAYLTPVDFRGDRAFLLASGTVQLSEERRTRLDEILFGDLENL